MKNGNGLRATQSWKTEDRTSDARLSWFPAAQQWVQLRARFASNIASAGSAKQLFAYSTSVNP